MQPVILLYGTVNPFLNVGNTILESYYRLYFVIVLELMYNNTLILNY